MMSLLDDALPSSKAYLVAALCRRLVRMRCLWVTSLRSGVCRGSRQLFGLSVPPLGCSEGLGGEFLGWSWGIFLFRLFWVVCGVFCLVLEFFLEKIVLDQVTVASPESQILQLIVYLLHF